LKENAYGSSVFGGYVPSNALDGLNDTYFLSLGGPNEFLAIRLPADISVTKINIRSKIDEYPAWWNTARAILILPGHKSSAYLGSVESKAFTFYYGASGLSSAVIGSSKFSTLVTDTSNITQFPSGQIKSSWFLVGPAIIRDNSNGKLYSFDNNVLKEYSIDYYARAGFGEVLNTTYMANITAVITVDGNVSSPIFGKSYMLLHLVLHSTLIF
jgi:hypothetical protein